MKRLLQLLLLVLVVAGIGLFGVSQGWFHTLHGGGEIVAKPRPADVNTTKDAQDKAAASSLGRPNKQILFGDLHVHTTFSPDAFAGSLPMVQGEGAHPVSDACDFARYCSNLDFWGITDHGISLTQRKWEETQRVIKECNASAGSPANPDMVSFLGWEWTQIGSRADNHYGHKNVILRGTEGANIPVRPIAAKSPIGSLPYGAEKGIPSWQAIGLFAWAPGGNRMDYLRMGAFNTELRERDYCDENANTKDLPAGCIEWTEDPKGLFRKLKEWDAEAIVIPHGTTWGYYTPAGVSLDKQLTAEQNDPKIQTLVEVFSGHGNSDEYRDWRAMAFDGDGKAYCPAPTKNYLPSCWRAGEIIETRCLAEGTDATECSARAAQTRDLYLAGKNAGFRVVPGATAEDWLDSGQCRDCYLPSFNYRPGNSVQYALAITNFDDPDNPKRFNWGIMASSDNHQARPGTGYKEFGRYGQTESISLGGITSNPLAPTGSPASKPEPFDPENSNVRNFDLSEAERQGSFFLTGGLIATHADGRDRDSIWNAMQRREVYGTSGDRMLLWFDLIDEAGVRVPMGAERSYNGVPRFEVRAMGAFKQKPGCPDYASSALGPDKLAHICQNECYNPSDERKRITRIEVVRIRPQIKAGEDVAGLIEDPWKTFPCDATAAANDGCAINFEDADFPFAGRDTTYYVRAVEEAGSVVNGAGLNCTYDEDGTCIAVDVCTGDPAKRDINDNCLAPAEELAWSSPIFLTQ